MHKSDKLFASNVKIYRKRRVTHLSHTKNNIKVKFCRHWQGDKAGLNKHQAVVTAKEELPPIPNSLYKPA
jgi:hypothetical protein